MKPFRYGCVVKGDAFCARPNLQSRLATHIRDGQNVVLIGERRMGKTSLIFSVAAELMQYRFLYVDLLNIRTVSDFCNRVATAAARIDRRPTLSQRILELLARLRPTLTIDPQSGMPVVSVDTQAAEDPRASEDMIGLIEKLSKDEQLFVVFDEFQEVRRLDAADQFLALLRSRIQFLDETCFVFSGSVRDDMLDIFTNPDSPFFKSAMTLRIGSVPDEDFAPFLISRFATGGRLADRSFINQIFDFTNRVTGDVQQLCSAVWNTTEPNTTLTAEHIPPAIEEIFEQEGDAYQGNMSRLTRFQLKTLVALARHGGKNVYSADFLRAAGLASAAAATRALKRLCEFGLIYIYEKEYRFFNPFLRAWILHRQF